MDLQYSRLIQDRSTRFRGGAIKVKEDLDIPVVQEALEVPSNVIDITTRKRATIPARPNARAQRRPNLQLVKFSPTELPAA